MTTTNLLLGALLLIAVACYAYIWFASQKLRDRHDQRLEAEERARSSQAPIQSPPAAAASAPPPTAPAPAIAPAASSASPFLAHPEGPADNLLLIKGIGPKLQARLTELGVFHFAQIANWTAEQLQAVDSQLGNFQGRPLRDQWQSQARLLAAGDLKGYERTHGKLESGKPAPSAAGTSGAGAATPDAQTPGSAV